MLQQTHGPAMYTARVMLRGKAITLMQDRRHNKQVEIFT